MRRTHICGLLVLLSSTAMAQDKSSYERGSQHANALLHNGDYARAGQAFERLFASHKLYIQPFDQYNAACAWARAGNKDKAFEVLFAVAKSQHGDIDGDKIWNNYIRYLFDPDLQSLVTDDRWEEFRRMIYSKRHPIANTLDTIILDDYKHRKKLEKDRAEVWKLEQQILDSMNVVRIEKIFSQYGWPSRELAGKRAGVILVKALMHAPVDIKKKYLPLLRDAVAARKVYWEALPALEDRIAIEEGRRQKYGTQVATDERGVYYLLPVENCDSLESWRRKAGLPPMRDFLKGSDITWDPEHHRKRRPKIEAALADGRLTPLD